MLAVRYIVFTSGSVLWREREHPGSTLFQLRDDIFCVMIVRCVQDRGFSLYADVVKSSPVYMCYVPGSVSENSRPI